MKTHYCAAALAAVGLSALANAGSVTSEGPDLIIKSKGGLSIKTADGDYSFKVGGRIMLDADVFDGVINNVEGQTGSDVYFRRLRTEVKGHIKDWSYKISVNLNNEADSVDLVYVTYNGWSDLARLTIGQQKEDFGMTDTGSSKWITGIERSIASDAFDVGGNIGVKLHGHNDAISYSVGLYQDGSDSNNKAELAYTGRFVFRPINGSDGILHLGAGYSHRSSESGFDDFDVRLGVRGSEAGNTVNKGGVAFLDNSGAGIAVDGDTMEVYNLEVAGIFGAFHFLGEYFGGEISDLDTAGTPNLEADGYSLQAAYVLTGEQRKYKNKTGVLDKIKPSGKGGAWEVFGRLDNLGGDSGTNINANETDVYTVGVNWYANSNIKAALNYLHVQTDNLIGGEDDGNAVAARLQVVF